MKCDNKGKINCVTDQQFLSNAFSGCRLATELLDEVDGRPLVERVLVGRSVVEDVLQPTFSQRLFFANCIWR